MPLDSEESKLESATFSDVGLTPEDAPSLLKEVAAAPLLQVITFEKRPCASPRLEVNFPDSAFSGRKPVMQPEAPPSPRSSRLKKRKVSRLGSPSPAVADASLQDVAFDADLVASPLLEVNFPEVTLPTTRNDAPQPRRSSRLQQTQELLHEQKEESSRVESAIADAESIPGESPAAKLARIMLTLNSDTIMVALEQQDKNTRLKAKERVRFTEPSTPSKVEKSDEEKLLC